MQTLDELLEQRAAQVYQEGLGDNVNVSTWTKENRLEKLGNIRSLAEGVSELTLGFVKELLETEVDGKPVLYYQVLAQFIVAELEFLSTLRAQLDTLEDVSELPVTHEFITEQIKKRGKEIQELQKTISDAMSKNSAVEEL